MNAEPSTYQSKDLEKFKFNIPSPAIIDSVEHDSIGHELGIEPGDKIKSINGIEPRDLIDYKYLISEEEIELEIIDQEGTIHMIEFEKEADENLGLNFKEALFDGLKQCNNNCPFCFIDQQPPGKRNTLYLKDDDYRMSFLYGSYLTLTNLNSHDWERIEEQNLSPLYVSVHSTNPILRAKLLKNKNAALLMDQLQWFKEKHLQIHAQVVVCPGLNDGNELERTLLDLSKFNIGEWPAVISTAVVPVGLTRFRPENDGLTSVDETCAQKVIDQVEILQKLFKKENGSRFAWLSDEWYLIAKRPLPIIDAYENFPQEENGVGSIRAFIKELEKQTENLPSRLSKKRNVSWVVGSMVKNAFLPIEKKMNQVENLNLNLHGLKSPYWGREQVVTGLLTGQDLIDGLSNLNLGQYLMVPSVMVKHDQPVFLDDLTIEEVSQSLKIPIIIVHGAKEVIDTALGNLK